MKWFEISNFEHLGGNPTGIPRLIKSVLSHMVDLDDCGFFIYDPNLNDIFVVEKDSVKAAITIQMGQRGNDDFQVRTFSRVTAGSKEIIKKIPFAIKIYRFLRKPRKIKTYQPLTYGPPLETVLREGDKLISIGGTWDWPRMLPLIRAYKQRFKVKYIGFVHDLIAYNEPHFFNQSLSLRLKDWLHELIETGDAFAVYSEHVGQQLKSLLKQRKKTDRPVFRYRLGDEIAFEPKPNEMIPLQRYGINKEFVLTVGTFEIRKNHYLLYKVWKYFVINGIAPPQLVIVGKMGWLANEVKYQMCNDPQVNSYFLFLEDASDQLLAELYSKCLFTVYPSLSEGWGLPVAEALVYHKLPIASNLTSIPEIGGELVVYIDPNNYFDAYKTIKSYIQNKGLLAEKESAIKQQYKITKWIDTAKAIADFAEQL